MIEEGQAGLIDFFRSWEDLPAKEIALMLLEKDNCRRVRRNSCRSSLRNFLKYGEALGVNMAYRNWTGIDASSEKKKQ